MNLCMFADSCRFQMFPPHDYLGHLGWNMSELFSAMTQQAGCMKPIGDLPIECVGRHNLANPTMGTKFGVSVMAWCFRETFHVNSWIAVPCYLGSTKWLFQPTTSGGEKRSTKPQPLNLKLTKPYMGRWLNLLVMCETLIDRFCASRRPPWSFPAEAMSHQGANSFCFFGKRVDMIRYNIQT